MSTNSTIARPTPNGLWEGRSVHSDGYPTGVGFELFRSYHDEFMQDVEEMRTALIDDEPYGWSAICGFNLALPSQWTEGAYRIDPAVRRQMGPMGYSQRGGESREPLIHPSDRFGSWTYVLEDEGLRVIHVLSSNECFLSWDGVTVEAAEAELDRIEQAAHEW